MLLKGSARGGAADLAKHVQKEVNEKVSIVRSRGVMADDIDGALLEMDALGSMLRTGRTLYHLSINPEPGKDREMDESEWRFCEEAALKKLGLANQPFIVIEHEKIGKEDGIVRRHRHIVASLADLEHMRAIRTDHNYRKHEEIA